MREKESFAAKDQSQVWRRLVVSIVLIPNKELENELSSRNETKRKNLIDIRFFWLTRVVVVVERRIDCTQIFDWLPQLSSSHAVRSKSYCKSSGWLENIAAAVIDLRVQEPIKKGSRRSDTHFSIEMIESLLEDHAAISLLLLLLLKSSACKSAAQAAAAAAAESPVSLFYLLLLLRSSSGQAWPSSLPSFVSSFALFASSH